MPFASDMMISLAFDPKRSAVLLVAGDKSGGAEKKFYKRLIQTADERLDRHLKTLAKGKPRWRFRQKTYLRGQRQQPSVRWRSCAASESAAIASEERARKAVRTAS